MKTVYQTQKAVGMKAPKRESAPKKSYSKPLQDKFRTYGTGDNKISAF
jgi:hypothetical protein